MTKLIQLTLVLFSLVFATAAYAGDSEVEIDLDQSITMDTVDISSDSGTVEVFIGGVIARDNSEIKAEIDSEISVRNLDVSTTSGKSVALIGAIVAGS